MRCIACRLALAGFLGALPLLSSDWVRAAPQESNSASPGVTFSNPGQDAKRLGPAEVQMLERQAKLRNEDRHKKLVGDTEKLYALAGELKEEVAKSNKDTLSVDVIKKAEEIERLAHNVKEKMKG